MNIPIYYCRIIKVWGYIFTPLDGILRTILKIFLKSFLQQDLWKTHEKREKYARGLNPDSIRSFHQFCLSLQEHRKKVGISAGQNYKTIVRNSGETI